MEKFYPKPTNNNNNVNGKDETKNKCAGLSIETIDDPAIKRDQLEKEIKPLYRSILIQMIMSSVIIICQIILFGLNHGNFKSIDRSAICIWGPTLFFFTAGGFSWFATKRPTKYLIGTAIGFQCISGLIAFVVTIWTAGSLILEYGRHYYNPITRQYDSEDEIPGHIICAIIIVCAVAVLSLSVAISIQTFRVCCSKLKANKIMDVDGKSQLSTSTAC